MSTPSEPRKPPTPLQKSIKKYQTAQVKRLEDEKRSTQSAPIVAPVPVKTAPASPSALTPPSVSVGTRATQTVEVITDRVGWSRQQWAILASAALLIALICVGAGAIAVGQTAQLTPTFAPLPTVKASDVLKRLQTLGVTIANVQTVSVPSKTWSATQAVQFDVKQGDQLDTFLVLTYNSAAQAGIDAFKASADAKYRTWHVMQTTNALVLSFPNTPATLDQMVYSHITQYLVAPYRDFLPTSTPGK